MTLKTQLKIQTLILYASLVPVLKIEIWNVIIKYQTNFYFYSFSTLFTGTNLNVNNGLAKVSTKKIRLSTNKK